MDKIFLYIIFLALFPSVLNINRVEVHFDYSNIQFSDKNLEQLLKDELDTVSHYISDLFYSYPSFSMKRYLKKIKHSKITCKDERVYKIKKDSTPHSSRLIIIPYFSFVYRYKESEENPKIKTCYESNGQVIVIIVEYKFYSEKQMKKILEENFNNFFYQKKIIRYIFTALGFNSKFLAKKKIINNILLNNNNILEKNEFYKSYQKFNFLSHNKPQNNQTDNKKYLDFWPTQKKLNDLMSDNISKNGAFAISEITLNLMNQIDYNISSCELVLYKKKCYRANNKCLNDFDYDDYYLYYTLDEKKKKWICYYKTETHFQKNQCSKDYVSSWNILVVLRVRD